MSKSKYYIKVTTFSNTTKLGEIVAQQVRATYNKSVVTSGREVERITEFIINAQNEAIKENAKLKRMNVKYFTGKVTSSLAWKQQTAILKGWLFPYAEK